MELRGDGINIWGKRETMASDKDMNKSGGSGGVKTNCG